MARAQIVVCSRRTFLAVGCHPCGVGCACRPWHRWPGVPGASRLVGFSAHRARPLAQFALLVHNVDGGWSTGCSDPECWPHQVAGIGHLTDCLIDSVLEINLSMCRAWAAFAPTIEIDAPPADGASCELDRCRKLLLGHETIDRRTSQPCSAHHRRHAQELGSKDIRSPVGQLRFGAVHGWILWVGCRHSRPRCAMSLRWIPTKIVLCLGGVRADPAGSATI